MAYMFEISNASATGQGIWQDADRNSKLHGNLRAYYIEDSVNYAEKNNNLHRLLNNYKTVPKGIFS